MVTLREFHVEHEDVRMRVLTAGEGAPLLLVHGYGGSAESWYFNTESLAEHYRVYAMDLPGFGLSTKVALSGPDGFAGWLERLLEHQGLASAHVAGNSMGGAVALALALSRPERVRSVILVDPLGLGPLGTTDFQKRMIGARDAKDLRELFALIVRDPGIVTDAMLERQLAVRALPGAVEVLAQLGPRLEGWAAAYRGRLSEIPVPQLVVWGRHDRIIPAANAAAADGVAQARVHIFEDCGHIPQIEDPGAFNALVQEFLEAV